MYDSDPILLFYYFSHFPTTGTRAMRLTRENPFRRVRVIGNSIHRNYVFEFALDNALFIERIIVARYLIAIFVPHKIEMHAGAAVK